MIGGPPMALPAAFAALAAAAAAALLAAAAAFLAAAPLGLPLAFTFGGTGPALPPLPTGTPPGALPRSGRRAPAAAAGGTPSNLASAAIAFALAAIELLLVVVANFFFKKSAKLSKPVLYEEQRVGRRASARRELLHARCEIADLAHFEHLALVVNGVQAQQVARDVRTVANAAAAERPSTWNAFQKNRMRLSHN